MLVPLSWLKEYVDISISVEELAEKLTLAGMEVEHIEYVGLPGGYDKTRLVWDREKLVMGHILEVKQHPNADRLVLATVDYGGKENEVVVTGAPNLFVYRGQGDIREQNLYSPLALEGAELYDGHKEGQVKMRLKGRELRGVYNRCMLCSEKELGISEEHEGILILPGPYLPGTSLQDVLGDAVLDIDIIPNIARCASMLGIAREVAALTGATVRYPDDTVEAVGPSVEGRVMITTEEPDLNPRFVAMMIEGVEQKPSPLWMQRRLRLAGQRPINVVVDVSNYVMLEWGQPNHTFDYDFLRRRADTYNGSDGPIHLITRLAEEGEVVTTLDEVERKMSLKTILVTDPMGALSIGGIMGGANSEINDGTTNVLLEAAAWNFINIRRSSHMLKMNTEAGFRFSRGVHPAQALRGAKRAAHLLQNLAGGTVRQGIVDYYPQPMVASPIHLTASEVRRIGGVDLSLAEIGRILRGLEFEVVEVDDGIEVASPDHRIDIEGAHDLIEEVCRIYGYDNLPNTIMDDWLPPQRGNWSLEVEEHIKDILARCGMQEVITHRLTSPERENKLLSITEPDDRPYVQLTNPISVDRVTMRHSLLASVLEIAAANSRFQEHMALYEIGPIFLASEENVLPDELTRLAMVLTGPRQYAHWQDNGEGGGMDFFDLKGIIETVLSSLKVADVSVITTTHPTFRPGYTARLLLGKQQLGVIGELHPLVLEALDWRITHPVYAADIDLDVLTAKVPKTFPVTAVTPYPAVREDIAVIVDQAVTAAEVKAVIERAGGFLLQAVELFDVYEGRQIPTGKKSLAYHLTFQAPDKTLNDKTVRKNRQRILKQLQQKLGAQLRD